MDISNKKKFFVLGLGMSGKAITHLLATKGFKVVVFDDSRSTLNSFFDTPGFEKIKDWIEVATGDNVLRHLIQSDCIVVSPGVSLDHALVQKARAEGIEITGEIELAYHFCSADIVGVTGTNGKSTVVSLLGDIFSAAGKRVVVAGNIGTPFSSVVEAGDPLDVVVLEVSSFQLDTIRDFKAQVAVLLNVTADHLDRYGNSLDKYIESKSKILNGADRNTWFIYNREDVVCRRLASTFDGHKVPFSATTSLDAGVYIDNGSITRRWEGDVDSILLVDDFSPVGIHNLENALAAVAAGTPFKIEKRVVAQALEEYRPLPHRMELAGVVDHVTYINDSKATNVDATIKSVRSISGPVVLIMGGLDKNGDYTSLIEHLGNVKRVVLLGEAKDKIEAALAGHCALSRADTMQEAIELAREATTAGDTVLLAPACASFDMFRDYAARGEAFKAVVRSF